MTTQPFVQRYFARISATLRGSKITSKSYSILFLTLLSCIHAAPFTIQLTKSDRPGELVHITDEQTSKWRKAEEKEIGFPPAPISAFDEQLSLRPGARVVTWLKHFSVDGKRIFQKRYKGKFLFREASAEIDLADGRHVLNPGGHTIEVKGNQATSTDPDVTIKKNVIALTCYPVMFAGLNMSVEPDEPLVERMTALPEKLFNVEVFFKKEAAPEGEEQPSDWDDLLEIHKSFQPLIVYLPANTKERAYRVLPSRTEFRLSAGMVELLGDGQPVANDVYATGASLWIPRYTSKAIARSKTIHPLVVSLNGNFSEKTSVAAVTADTFEERIFFHQFFEPRTREFNAGLPGKKPATGIEVACDPAEYPHRLLIADNRHPKFDDARLLSVGLKQNICQIGDSIQARIDFRDSVDGGTLDRDSIAAFIRKRKSELRFRLPNATQDDWSPVKLEAGAEANLYQILFEGSSSGLFELRIVVDAAGKASPQSDLHADFNIALEQKDESSSSLSLFTHYNRHSFYEDEGFELIGALSNSKPLNGELVIRLRELETREPSPDKAEEKIKGFEIARQSFDSLTPGQHTLHWLVLPQTTMFLRVGDYELVGELEGCRIFGGRVRLVGRKKSSSMVIALQPSWEGSVNGSFHDDAGLDFLFDNLKELGINQLIETPPQRPAGNIVAIQERTFTGTRPGLPAWDFLYEPTLFQKVLDRTLGEGTDMWLWRHRLVENLRWGPLEDLDVDRGQIQFYGNLARDLPHIEGMDLGWWEAVEYIDMGGRSGSYPEQQKQREEIMLPRIFKEKYGFEYPSLTELSDYTETFEDKNNFFERQRLLQELRCSLMPDTFEQYEVALHRIRPGLQTTHTEQEVMISAPAAAFIPEVAYAKVKMSRWQSTHENGTRPLSLAVMSAFGKFDESARVSTINCMLHFHIPRMRRTHFRLWQRMLMALACGADEVGYQDSDVYLPVTRRDAVTGHGFTSRSHILERIAVSSVNRGLEMYSGIFKHARRERDIAILHSITQLGFEYVYFGAEWHNNDPYYRYLITPFHRGGHMLRVESAFSGFLWSHLPADIIGERAILSGKLDGYKGLAVTGIELPKLPANVMARLAEFIKKGGVVMTDDKCRVEIPGAVKLGFTFDFIRAGWSNRNEYRGMQHEYDKVKERMNTVLDARFKHTIRCDSDRVLLSSAKWGGSRFITAAGDRILKDTSFQGAYAREPIRTTMHVAGEAGAVYDLFEMKRLDIQKDSEGILFPTDLTKVGAKVFAVLPTEIAQPTMQVTGTVNTGELATVTVSVKDKNGQPSDILVPIELRLIDPQGKTRHHLFRAVLGAETFEEEFKIAANDPAGVWKVTASELFEGRTVEATFKVVELAAKPAIALSQPDVVVYGADEIRKFVTGKPKAWIPYEKGIATAKDTDKNTSHELAKQLKTISEQLGLEEELRPVSELAVIRRNLPRKTTNFSEKQVGPRYTFKGHAVIPDVGGRNPLVRSLVATGILPVRLTGSFPGPGRGAILHVVSPFYYGFDSIIVSGGDAEGFAKALKALANPEKLKDIERVKAPQLAKATSEVVTAVSANKEGSVGSSRTMIEGLNGMPVMQLAVSRDGKQILVGSENFSKNVFMLDGNGKVLWSGKGAKKWPGQMVMTKENGALMFDMSGGIYELNASGETVSRFGEIDTASLSAHGDTILAAGPDMTVAAKLDGSILWREDYFLRRSRFGEFRSGSPRDDLVALTPNGRYGLIFDWGIIGEGKKRQMFRKMRAVDMQRGNVLGAYEFAPHESVSEPYMRADNFQVRFAPNSGHMVIANATGKIFMFSMPNPRLMGSYTEHGPILTKPIDKMPGSPRINPTAWQARVSSEILDIDAGGSRTLVGFSTRRVVILDCNGRALQSFSYEGTVSSGTFLGQNTLVYADDLLRAYNLQGKKIWELPLPVIYSMKAVPDGKSVLCGSTGGYVYRVGADGKVLWKTDLHPASHGNVDELFRTLASAQEKNLGPARGQKSELERIAANVRLSPNLIPEGKRAAFGLKAGQKKEITAAGSGAEGLGPFSTYAFSVWWKPANKSGRLKMTAELVEEGGDPVVYETEFTVTSPGWLEALLPVKTGPKPKTLKIRISAGSSDIAVKDAGLYQANFGIKNAALVEQAFQGITRESRLAGRRQQTVMLRHLEGNLQEAVTLAPIEMTDGRITRSGSSRWTAGDVGQMGGVEISYAKPKTIGSFAFYDDPAYPRAWLKQYMFAYFVEKQKVEKKEETTEKTADQIQFTDKWAGEWKTAEVERSSKTSVHIHRLAKPITSRRFRISGLLNADYTRREEETRITELELYESRWHTAGGNFQRTYYQPNGQIPGPLVMGKSALLQGRRFVQSSPTFANGLLYLASGGTLNALSLEDHSKIWKLATKKEYAILSQPTVDGDFVIFGSNDHEVRAVSTRTGEVVWSYPTEFRITGSPCIVGDKIVIGSGDGIVYAFDRESGDLKWQFKAGQSIHSSVATDGKNTFFSAFNHQVHSLDEAGKERWSFKTGSSIRSGVAVGADRVFVGSDDGHVYALNKDDGKKVWSFKTSGLIEAAPAIDERNVYIGSVDGRFRAISQQTGKQLWEIDATSPIRQPALIVGHEVYFYSDDSTLRQIEKTTGKEISTINFRYPGLTGLTPVGNSILFGTRSGYLTVTTELKKK
jgi:outer membrane protein assembly factor BamB